MKTLAVAVMFIFGFGFAAFGMGAAVQDLELSEKGYENFDGEIGAVSNGIIKEGEFAGWRLYSKSKVTTCAKRVAPHGSASYKCQEVVSPLVAKTLFGFSRAPGRVLALMHATPALPPEQSEAMYGNMRNIPEVSQGPIREGILAGHELFTKSLLVVYGKMVAPDGRVKFVKKVMINPSLE